MAKIWRAALFGGILAFGGLFMTQSAQAADDLKTFDVASDPDFGKARPILEKYAQKNRPHEKNSFCVLGLINHANSKLAYVFWPEKNEMFLWGGEDLSEFEPSKIWDLKKDVVAKETPESRTSTYLIQQSEVDRLREACTKAGLHLDFPK